MMGVGLRSIFELFNLRTLVPDASSGKTMYRP